MSVCLWLAACLGNILQQIIPPCSTANVATLSINTPNFWPSFFSLSLLVSLAVFAIGEINEWQINVDDE